MVEHGTLPSLQGDRLWTVVREKADRQVSDRIYMSPRRTAGHAIPPTRGWLTKASPTDTLRRKASLHLRFQPIEKKVMVN